VPQRLKPDPLLNVNQSSEQNINPRTAREEIRKEEMKEQRTVFYVVAALILAFGLYLLFPVSNNNDTNNTQSIEQSSEISYKGVEGKTAMELLKASHQVEVQSFDFGDMVQSIDGKKPGEGETWSFYVNGKLASVGADAYQTKNSDTITWKIEKY